MVELQFGEQNRYTSATASCLPVSTNNCFLYPYSRISQPVFATVMYCDGLSVQQPLL